MIKIKKYLSGTCLFYILNESEEACAYSIGEIFFCVHWHETHEICQVMVPPPTVHPVLTVAPCAWSFILKHCLLQEDTAVKCGKPMTAG